MVTKLTHLSQIFMLNTFNLYSAVCQLYFNETGKKNKQPTLKKEKKIRKDISLRKLCICGLPWQSRNKTLNFHYKQHILNPGQGTKILNAVWQREKKKIYIWQISS